MVAKRLAKSSGMDFAVCEGAAWRAVASTDALLAITWIMDLTPPCLLALTLPCVAADHERR